MYLELDLPLHAVLIHIKLAYQLEYPLVLTPTALRAIRINLCSPSQACATLRRHITHLVVTGVQGKTENPAHPPCTMVISQMAAGIARWTV